MEQSCERAVRKEGRYVLISPCRNEAKFMRQTLDSVIAQSVRPSQWVIVDDGSSDESAEILAEYASRHDWIQIVTRNDRGYRDVGPGVVDAFYTGYSTIVPNEFEFLCKLDLDLRLPPRYFEILMRRMAADAAIATCSGKSHVEQNGRLRQEQHGDDTSLGMTKFYRTSCFEAIGGFVREVMWDGIDCHQCRMKGWTACSWNDPDLRFVHLRPVGSSQQGVLAGRVRHGYGQYFMGTSFLFILASAASRISEKPYLLGSLAMMWGWLSSALKGLPRYEEREFRPFLRSYQARALLLGKKRALASLENRRRSAKMSMAGSRPL